MDYMDNPNTSAFKLNADYGCGEYARISTGVHTCCRR